jgi:hypothetical protein
VTLPSRARWQVNASIYRYCPEVMDALRARGSEVAARGSPQRGVSHHSARGVCTLQRSVTSDIAM